jgi:hypothetical protein
MSTERGEYRSIRTVIVDGPDFRKLTPAAKLVWYTLKLQLGPSGIGVINALDYVLMEQTGLTLEMVRAGLAELNLTAPRNHGTQQWIRREANVVEIVDGLKHEPSISMANVNHRKAIANHLAGLPNVDLVRAFRKRYLEPPSDHAPCHNDPMPDTENSAGDRPENGAGMPMPSTEDGRRNTEEGIGKTENGNRPAPPARDVELACLTALSRNQRLAKELPDSVAPFVDAMAGAARRFITDDYGTLARVIVGYCVGALDGMHGPQRTVEDLQANLSDYAIAKIEGAPSGRHLQAFLYRDPKVQPGQRSNGSAPQSDRTLHAGELIRQVRSHRNPQFPSSVLPGWDMLLSPAEKRAVAAIGLQRILEAAPKDEAALVPQLAKALQQAKAQDTPTTTTTKP